MNSLPIADAAGFNGGHRVEGEEGKVDDGVYPNHRQKDMVLEVDRPHLGRGGGMA